MRFSTGRKIINKKIKCAKLIAFFETLPRCALSTEACESTHHCAGELSKLGHDLRLMPAAYVNPYVPQRISAESPNRGHGGHQEYQRNRYGGSIALRKKA